ncbi:lytic transglycosylase domain-containing protein [soil metagenome]
MAAVVTYSVRMAILCLACAVPAIAQAQVLEIAENGDVTRHDRPAIFDGDGSQVIATTRRLSAASHPTSSALTDAARMVELSPELIEAVAWRESRLRPRVVSPAGAIGEMQLMPGTARQLGVDPYDTRENFRGGATYLRQMLVRYDGDIIRALAAYNAGPGAVDRYGGVPPYRETREYIADILERMSTRVAQDDNQPKGF